MTSHTVQVKDGSFTDSSKFIHSPVEVDSDTWFCWLKEPDVRSFHYQSDTGKFTARKEERATSTNEYWYAYRKVQGKLRKVYLGAMEELTGDRLEQVAREISQPSWEFYSSRKSYTTKKEKNCVTALIGEQSYPTNIEPSCVTPSSEVEELRTEVEQLRSQLEEVTKKDVHEQTIEDLKRNLEETYLELSKVRSQLQTEKALHLNMSNLHHDCLSDGFKAANILKEALLLKPNAGGAIKKKIREALKLVDDI
jgi:uncharacterized coiled-coil protein SlyX